MTGHAEHVACRWYDTGVFVCMAVSRLRKEASCWPTAAPPYDGKQFVGRHDVTFPDLVTDLWCGRQSTLLWQGVYGEYLMEVVHHLAVYPAAQGAWGD